MRQHIMNILKFYVSFLRNNVPVSSVISSQVGYANMSASSKETVLLTFQHNAVRILMGWVFLLYMYTCLLTGQH